MKKEISFNDAYVTCLTCDCCYDQHNQPTFCQVRSMTVDIRKVLANMDMASKCNHWFPKDIGRRNCGKEYDTGDRWYEKDSMG